jgi:hypothetical protein
MRHLKGRRANFLKGDGHPFDAIGLHGAAGGLVTCRGQLDTPQRPADLDS